MRAAFILVLVMVLSGCSIPERNTVTRPLKLSEGDGRLIDATQRGIISVRRDLIGSDGQPLLDDKGERVTDLVVCAEPSPDALQATATALGGEVGEKVLDALLTFSGSTAESAASIGLRTQTIQLLRDAYFRLCEAYLNDGIDAIAYDILQRRFQSQIVALLAVEQLTGAVKAQQVALNTSAAADAGSQAALIARMLEDAEKELSQLQEEKSKNAKELETLEGEKKELAEAKKAAEKKVADAKKAKEAAQGSGNAEAATAATEALAQAETELEKAKNKVTVNASAIEAAKREQSQLDEQIKRRQHLVKTLEGAFAAAVQATVKSSASGAATFGDAGEGSGGSFSADVANAVRAITLNAINQDYEAQVCFETLRFRNNLGQFRNVVNQAIDSAGLPEGLEGGAFLDYCRSLFEMQADLRGAHVSLVEAYPSVIDAVIEKIDKGKGGITAEEAAGVILSLSEIFQTVPGLAFMPRTLEFESPKPRETNGDDVESNSQQRGVRYQQKLHSGAVDIILPTTLTTAAEVGVPRVRLQCADGQKPNPEGTECVERCSHEGVRYDEDTDECVAKTVSVKMATWNIEHLRDSAGEGRNPRTEADYLRLATYATLLDADVVALQEVENEAALSKVFDPTQYQFFVSDRSHSQRTAFVVRRPLAVTRHPDLQALNVTGGLRHGVDIELAVAGQSIRLLAVHLKSFCFEGGLFSSTDENCKKLATQVPVLEQWIDDRATKGTPFVVLGDFNRRFDAAGDEFWLEIDDGDPAGLDLSRATEGARSACWGGRHPRYIDHIVYDRLVAEWVVPGSFEQLVYTESDKQDVLSDHCPIALTLDVE